MMVERWAGRQVTGRGRSLSLSSHLVERKCILVRRPVPPANYSFLRLKIVSTERNVTDCPLPLGGLTGMTCSWNRDKLGGKKEKIFSLHNCPNHPPARLDSNYRSFLSILQ